MAFGAPAVTDSEAVEQLFEKSREFGLLELLHDHAAGTAFVCDERYLPFFRERFGRLEAARVAPVEDFIARPSHQVALLCMAGDRDAQSKRAVRAACEAAGAAPLDLLEEVFYPLSFGQAPRWSAGEVAPPPPLPTVRYGVICSGRSGSTYLCDLLANCGMGQPIEHLRPPLIVLARHADYLGFSPLHWYDGLKRACAPNGVFGTKFIGSYLANFLRALARAPRAAFLDDLRGYKFVHLARESKVEQAVSQFIANKSRIWHLRDNESRKQKRYARSRGDIEYSFDGIWTEYRKVIRDELWNLRFLDSNGLDAMRVHYEALMQDPAAQLGAIARHLGRPRGDDAAPPRSSLVKTADALNRGFAERFRADARSRIDEIYQRDAAAMFEEITG